jgi:hypothetical protein
MDQVEETEKPNFRLPDGMRGYMLLKLLYERTPEPSNTKDDADALPPSIMSDLLHNFKCFS